MNYSYFYISFDLAQLFFSFPHILISQCKYGQWSKVNGQEQKVKNNTKEFWDIGDSNQTELDLKNISENCEHLTDGIVSKIVWYIAISFTLVNILLLTIFVIY